MVESNPRARANEGRVSSPTSEEQSMPSTTPKSRGEITSSLAMQLIQLFFDNIQPWFPLLHKPRFLSWAEGKLSVEGDVLRGLNADEALTLCSISALAVRFSSHPRFADLSDLEKGDEFAELAAQAYGKSRLSSKSTVRPHTRLHPACILLLHGRTQWTGLDIDRGMCQTGLYHGIVRD